MLLSVDTWLAQARQSITVLLFWKLRLCKARGTRRNKCEPRKPERNPEAAWAEADGVTFFKFRWPLLLLSPSSSSSPRSPPPPPRRRCRRRFFLFLLLVLLVLVRFVCVCVCETRIPQRGESCQHSARNDATSPKKEKKPSLKARQIRPDKLIL